VNGPVSRVPGHTGPRPRLLIVGPLPPPIGGVETVTQAILESHAFGDLVVTHCDTTKQRPKETQGRFDLANAVWALRHFARLARALAGFRPDVVYIPIAGTWSGVLRDLALGWIARRSGARVIGHQHDGGIADVLSRGGLGGRIVRGGFAQFHRLLVLGAHWKRLFEDYGVGMPIEIVPSTLRQEVVEAGAKRAPNGASGALRILFVGQVGRRKGVPELLDAVKRLRDRGAAPRVTIVGPSEQPGELEAARAQSSRLGLDGDVTFTGPLTGEALYERYRTHDVFALPSHNEGLPVVLYEAAAFGLAVLATPVGSIPELIRDGENGVLVPPGDPGLIAAGIARLGDASLRARLAGRLAADIVAYHPDRVTGRIAEAVRAELARR